MLMTRPVSTLINSQNGNLAFRIFSFEGNDHFDHVQRLNYYTIILLTKGCGKLKADFSEYDFSENSIMCFSPYQPFMVSQTNEIGGMAINFHPDFFCIHKHQKEVACNGVLFNNIYQPPILSLGKEDINSFHAIISQMREEVQNAELAQYELLVSYLKIFLINASRLKVNKNSSAKQETAGKKEPFILQNLQNAIEQHYKSKHSPGDYSMILNISPKSLNKITKTHFNKTLTKLISERIVIEAKRELYLTSKTVKEIAYNLGFNDEYYFSRFFKINTDISPQIYRDTVGFAKSGL